ncbi:hypothetical protein ACTHGU_20115 [Chitinophagaceae bacterium MMS25-I14]
MRYLRSLSSAAVGVITNSTQQSLLVKTPAMAGTMICDSPV